MGNRVLMVATVPSMIGQFNMSNIHILLEMGYKVDVAADFNDTSVWPIERIQKFRSQMKELDVECIQLDFSRSPLKFGNHLRSYKEIVKLIENRHYSFIHTHTPIASAIVRQAAHKTGTKVIYTAHGFHFYDGAPLKNWLLFFPIEKHFSHYTDILITINNEDYKRASEKFYAKKTVKIPGVGVDTDKFAICKIDRKEKRAELGVRASDFLLLSVDRISERKNHKIVIEALHKMKEVGTIENVVYLVVGKEDRDEECRSLIKDYELEGHIKFLGCRTDIDELCEAVDCFVHLSVREGLESATLEAMATGLPLIFAKANGTKDYYAEDGIFGCCVDSASIEDIVEAIIHIRDDADFRRECANNNRRTAKTFDITNTNERMKDILRAGYKHLRGILIRQNKRIELGLELDDYVIISVGELNDNKNHQVIIKSIKNIPDVKYIIVGKGNLDNKLKELSQELGVERRVIFTGYRTDVSDLLWASDCFAFPSLREGLGVAALEGMAAGLPVIGHDIGGIRDFVINNMTGWLCKTDQDYADAILNCMKGNTILARECLQKAIEFDKSHTNSIMREVYADKGWK